MVEIRRAEPSRLPVIASALGRAFVTEPLLAWPLGPGADLEERCVAAFEYFLEDLGELGVVWEAGGGHGAAIWISPDVRESWDKAANDTRVYSLTDDGGRRYDALWTWVATKTPRDPWLLDSVGVVPEMQGHGIGRALIEHGLTRAREADAPVFLQTATPGNAKLYERLGFRVVEDADPPHGGPHVWFMRWDP